VSRWFICNVVVRLNQNWDTCKAVEVLLKSWSLVEVLLKSCWSLVEVGFSGLSNCLYNLVGLLTLRNNSHVLWTLCSCCKVCWSCLLPARSVVAGNEIAARSDVDLPVTSALMKRSFHEHTRFLNSQRAPVPNAVAMEAS
jgi:hypothetical protein